MVFKHQLRVLTDDAGFFLLSSLLSLGVFLFLLDGEGVDDGVDILPADLFELALELADSAFVVAPALDDGQEGLGVEGQLVVVQAMGGENFRQEVLLGDGDLLLVDVGWHPDHF